MMVYDRSMSNDRREVRDGLKHHPETDTYHVEFDYPTNPPSSVVTEAVADVADVEGDELDPLYDAIDPDALDNLFRPTMHGFYRGDGEVTFPFNGYQIAVRSYGLIEIKKATTEE